MPGFEIDEAKLQSALPPPESTYTEDAKWGFAFFGLAIGFIALALFALWLLLRAFA